MTLTVKTRIDRARTIPNFDFWWKYYSKFPDKPASSCRSIRELCLFKSSYISSLFGTYELKGFIPVVPTVYPARFNHPQRKLGIINDIIVAYNHNAYN